MSWTRTLSRCLLRLSSDAENFRFGRPEGKGSLNLSETKRFQPGASNSMRALQRQVASEETLIERFRRAGRHIRPALPSRRVFTVTSPLTILAQSTDTAEQAGVTKTALGLFAQPHKWELRPWALNRFIRDGIRILSSQTETESQGRQALMNQLTHVLAALLSMTKLFR